MKEHSLGKYTNQSSGRQHPCKSQAWIHVPVILGLGTGERPIRELAGQLV